MTHDVVSAWWAWRRAARGTREERVAAERGVDARFAGASEVDDVLEAGGQAAVDLVLALLVAADSADEIAFVGAGPLEDLLHEHGPSVVPLLQDAVVTQPVLRQALSAVWVGDGAEPSTREWLAGRVH